MSWTKSLATEACCIAFQNVQECDPSVVGRYATKA